MTPVEVVEGDGPVVLGLPHGGTWLPDSVTARLNENGRRLADTDWHIARLYEGLLPGATLVRAHFHRYLIDANRAPDDGSLYPGQNTTGLCPVTDFDGVPIWAEGQAPGGDEIADRRAAFHAPYHAALQAQVDRVKARHGAAVVYDCHSIRSVIPWLFEGTLPDFNTGTNNGATCDPAIESAVAGEAAKSGRTNILNGRFKGGWTTRHYGRPSEGLHAIQMELAQSSHLTTEAPPFALDASRTASLRPILARMLTRLTDLAPTLAQKR